MPVRCGNVQAKVRLTRTIADNAFPLERSKLARCRNFTVFSQVMRRVCCLEVKAVRHEWTRLTVLRQQDAGLHVLLF